MKKFYVIVLMCVFYSCTDRGPVQIYKRTIKNESGVPIKIYSYSGENFEKLNERYTLKLDKAESITKVSKDGPPYRGLIFANHFFGGSVPIRIKIIYNNKKVAYFKNRYGEDFYKERNILGSEYSNLLDPEITFIFTKEDYLDAEDCNGDCE